MNELIQLEEKFREISSNSERYLSEFILCALSVSTRSVISKGALYNLSPYEIQRAGFQKGRKLNKLPNLMTGVHAYHFDESERVTFIEVYGQTVNIVSKEFCMHKDNELERFCFTSTGSLRNILISQSECGRIEREVNWGMYGCSVSEYVYHGSMLQKISVRQKEHVDDLFSEFDVVFDYIDEELKAITNIFPNGYQEQRYP